MQTYALKLSFLQATMRHARLWRCLCKDICPKMYEIRSAIISGSSLLKKCGITKHAFRFLDLTSYTSAKIFI